MCAGKSKYQRTGLMLFLGSFVAVSMAAAQSRQPGRVLRLNAPETSGAFLGIQMDDVTAGNMGTYKLSSERGVVVRTVEKGSPAEAAKLQENDVILEYCGIPVLSAMQFSRLVSETPPGRTVDLVVSRDGKKINVSAKLGKREGASSLDMGDMSRWFNFQAPGGQFYQFRVPQGPRGGMQIMPSPGTQGKPKLGVTVQVLTDQMAEFLGVTGKTGVLVTSVEANSPSASKLKAGDVILSADGRRVGNPDDLSRILDEKSGGTLDLKVVRDRKEVAVTIDLPAGPIKL